MDMKLAERGRVPVVFASDDRGTTMLGVALCSLLRSREAGTHYVIYILDDGISELNKSRIAELCSGSAELTFIPIHELLEEHLHIQLANWPLTTFGRLFMPALMPQEERVLYLDIDTLVLKDLRALMEADPGDSLAAAVCEEQRWWHEERKHMFGMPAESRYFNAGIMILELGRMRREGVDAALLEYLKENEARLRDADQDVLNVVLCGRVRELHPRWNWSEWHTRSAILARKSNWGEQGREAAREAALDPAIVHFLGRPKPTQHNFHYRRGLYRRFWLQSPWRGESPSGGRLLRALRKRLMLLPADVLVWLIERLHRRG